VAAMDKREGDGKTPVGRWPIREGFYRADRLAKPETKLPMRAMSPDDAWCDIDGDPQYNRYVKLPYPTLNERLWRDDHLYDIIFMLGYNDSPAVAGKGSAIFLHLSRPEFNPSSGCVTLAQEDLLCLLREADAGSSVVVL